MDVIQTAGEVLTENIVSPPKKQKLARLSYEQLEQDECQQPNEKDSIEIKDAEHRMKSSQPSKEGATHVFPLAVVDEENYGKLKQ